MHTYIHKYKHIYKYNIKYSGKHLIPLKLHRVNGFVPATLTKMFFSLAFCLYSIYSIIYSSFAGL